MVWFYIFDQEFAQKTVCEDRRYEEKNTIF